MRRRSADEIAFISFGENSRCGDRSLAGQDASPYWFQEQVWILTRTDLFLLLIVQKDEPVTDEDPPKPVRTSQYEKIRNHGATGKAKGRPKNEFGMGDTTDTTILDQLHADIQKYQNSKLEGLGAEVERCVALLASDAFLSLCSLS